jgi:hypothetical protein
MADVKAKAIDEGWAPIVDGVEQPVVFGCEFSALGYGRAIAAAAPQPLQVWPCVLNQGKGLACAGIYAMTF